MIAITNGSGVAAADIMGTIVAMSPVGCSKDVFKRTMVMLMFCTQVSTAIVSTLFWGGHSRAVSRAHITSPV